jgi:hypothetical protein
MGSIRDGFDQPQWRAEAKDPHRAAADCRPVDRDIESKRDIERRQKKDHDVNQRENQPDSMRLGSIHSPDDFLFLRYTERTLAGSPAATGIWHDAEGTADER